MDFPWLAARLAGPENRQIILAAIVEVEAGPGRVRMRAVGEHDLTRRHAWILMPGRRAVKCLFTHRMRATPWR